MERKRVRAFFRTYPVNSSGERMEEMIQVLEVRRQHKFLWFTWHTWKEIDREVVPPGNWQQAFTLGSTEWKSKWTGMLGVEWCKQK